MYTRNNLALDKDQVDVTDDVVVKSTGVLFHCPCGNVIGMTFGTLSILCPQCDKNLVDYDFEDREEQAESRSDSAQSKLGSFT